VARRRIGARGAGGRVGDIDGELMLCHRRPNGAKSSLIAEIFPL
jgi:hypothetical protein